MDKRMGLSFKFKPPYEDTKCDTCREEWLTCVGHFGHIDLVKPVYHVGFMSHIVGILNMICKECSGLLFDELYVDTIRQKLRERGGMSFMEKKRTFKNMTADAKNIKQCRHCSASNGLVKVVSRFKIQYEPFSSLKDDDQAVLKFQEEFNEAVAQNRWLRPYREEKSRFINPQEALTLFEKIPEADVCILMLRESSTDTEYGAHPTSLILTKVPVAPSCIRPTVQKHMSPPVEDAVTTLVRQIVETNNLLSSATTNGGISSEKMQEGWDILQMRVALLFDGETKHVPASVANQPFRGFVQRLKGKQGRFRQNLEGKRCNFTARSVISPDPNLKIDQVGVPRLVAETLTFPEKVSQHNIEWLRKLVVNGPEHPGATAIQQLTSDIKYDLSFFNHEKREFLASKLKLGDTVNRHLNDGDFVLFNRQPSLHRMSIMCHRAKVVEGRTLRLNDCCCTAYNADFDGDEMNLHLPQTQEARVEAATLMDVKKNLVTPRNGEILIGLTQDSITGAYLLSQKDCFLTKHKAQQLMAQIMVEEDATLKFQMPVPAILKPYPLWTGKQILSFILTHYQNEGVEGGKVKINFRAPGKLYERDRKLFEMCPADSYLLIRNSELLAGTIEKGTVGTGSKVNIFLDMARLYNPAVATKAMWRISRVASYYLMTTGFSIGIGDVTPSEKLLETKEKQLSNGFKKCEDILKSLAEGKLDVMPGRTADETAEVEVLQTLSRIRDDLGKECIKELPRNNAPLIMAQCGSKGSDVNISQMVVCVGQQALNGKRVPNGFDERSLPHFKKKSKDPSSRGFVSSSFYSGLNPPEFVFHAMAGREGFVDTAVKTAETGYIQRRLMKCLEDLVVDYDNTVRTSTSDLIQIRYGGDGFDPVKMETDSFPIDLDKALDRSRCLITDRDGKLLTASEAIELAEKTMTQPDFDVLDEQSKDWDVDLGKRLAVPRITRPLVHTDYKKSILDFLKQKHTRIEAKWIECGLNTSDQSKWTAVQKSMDGTTEKQLSNFLKKIPDTFQKALIEPGEPVGAICGQSVGELARQMCSNTFHFAGVASLNISRGVPRLQEILNNAKTIATPLITVKLDDPYDERAARKVKALLERTTLGQVALEIAPVQNRNGIFVRIEIDVVRIELLQLKCDIGSIVDAIRASEVLRKAKLKSKNPVSPTSYNTIEIDISSTKLRGGSDAAASYLRNALTSIPIAGLPDIDRCVISKEDGRMEIFAEGLGMREVLATPGVNASASWSNHIDEVYNCLGIEAAQTAIIKEMTSIAQNHGIAIDPRHIKMIASNMTASGTVEGSTRYGLQNLKNSVLRLASFEQTSKHLFDAAFFGVTDNITGVSDNIIFGTNVPLGTNTFDLLYGPQSLRKVRRSPSKLTPLVSSSKKHKAHLNAD